MPVAHARVDPLGESLGPRERVHRHERSADIVVGRVGASEAHILGHRVREHVHLLRDHRHELRTIVRFHTVDRAPADRRLTVLGVEEPRDDLAERGLARAARADDREVLAGRDVERDPVEHARLGLVPEREVAHRDTEGAGVA